jgi:hypothetical protein
MTREEKKRGSKDEEVDVGTFEDVHVSIRSYA